MEWIYEVIVAGFTAQAADLLPAACANEVGWNEVVITLYEISTFFFENTCDKTYTILNTMLVLTPLGAVTVRITVPVLFSTLTTPVNGSTVA